MEVVMGLIIGLGLSAACGFRVFVPLLGMCIASLSGHLTLASGFEWIGTYPALIAFGTATILEIGAFYVPWLDNVMDAAATPAAIVAGSIVTASQLGDASPLLRWSLAIIAGGGLCGVIQVGTVATRAISTGTTGGLGNFLVSSIELVIACGITLGAIIVPVLCLIAVLISAVAMGAQIMTWRKASADKIASAKALVQRPIRRVKSPA